MKLASCLYRGEVRHARYSPIAHAFRYSLFLVYLDLGELDRVFRRRWLWSTRRPAPAWFRRADFLGNPSVPLDEAVRELVRQRTGRELRGPIRLLTHLRYFGYAFNPVSFYFCYDEAGETVDTVVAEVSNTPWNERHCYVLPRQSAGPGTMRFRHPKEFHVSPFMVMDVDYHWTIEQPGASLGIRVENRDRDGVFFSAGMSLERQEICGRSLAAVLLRHPWMTARIIFAIYAQALRLRCKGAPFQPHPMTKAGTRRTA